MGNFELLIDLDCVDRFPLSNIVKESAISCINFIGDSLLIGVHEDLSFLKDDDKSDYLYYLNMNDLISFYNQYQKSVKEEDFILYSYNHRKKSIEWIKKGIPGRIDGISVNEGEIYLSTYAGEILSLNALTSEIDWKLQIDRYASCHSISSHENFIIVLSGKRGTLAGSGGPTKISAISISHQLKIWDYTLNGESIELAIADRIVYVPIINKSELIGINADTRKVVHCVELAGRTIPIVTYSGIIYVGSENPNLIWVINQGKVSNKLVCPFSIYWLQICNDYIFAGNIDGKVLIIERKELKILQELELPERNLRSIHYRNGYLFAGVYGGKVYYLRI